MTTDTTAAETTTAAHDAPGPVWFRPVGRHRKPRPRRVVLAVGGFALAAGALSLVRLGPESVTGGGGSAQAEPRIDTTGAATGTTDTAGPVPSASTVHPVTTAALAGASAVPTTTATARPSAHPSSSAPRAADPATGIPEAPSTPTASRTTGPVAATTPAAPRPTPSPTATPRPSHPTADPPGLCVPIVGLCVNGLSGPGR